MQIKKGGGRGAKARPSPVSYQDPPLTALLPCHTEVLKTRAKPGSWCSQYTSYLPSSGRVAHSLLTAGTTPLPRTIPCSHTAPPLSFYMLNHKSAMSFTETTAKSGIFCLSIFILPKPLMVSGCADLKRYVGHCAYTILF